MKEYKNKKLAVVTVVIFVTFLRIFGAVESVLAMSNPAAIYCRDLGYEYAVEKTSEGEFGFCKLPDGLKAEEWKFFAGQEKQDYNYCGMKGYTTKTISDERCLYSSPCALCVLEDGSEKEVSKLMGLSVPAPEYSIPIMPVAPAETTKPIPSGKDNTIYYLVVIAVAVILSIVAFVVYKKTKNKE